MLPACCSPLLTALTPAVLTSAPQLRCGFWPQLHDRDPLGQERRGASRACRQGLSLFWGFSAVPKSVPFWAALVGARWAPDLSLGSVGPAAPLTLLAPHAISGNTVVEGQGSSPVAVTLLRRYRDILPSAHWLLVPAMATGRERTCHLE